MRTPVAGRVSGRFWPASAAFNSSGSISVGGTSIQLNGTATTTWNGTSLNISFDANSTGFSVVSAWWDTTGCPTTCAGSEGGLSTVFPEPYWQLHSAAQPPISAASAEQGASALGRAGPDVAFPANATIAYVYADASENVYFTVLEGTSVAAPVFAGLLADVIAVENRSGQDLGFGYLDPEIYRVASFYTAHPGSASPFLDVTVGQNYVFSAGSGWDATTGWGGLNALRFLAADENATITSFQYTGPLPGIPSDVERTHPGGRDLRDPRARGPPRGAPHPRLRVARPGWPASTGARVRAPGHDLRGRTPASAQRLRVAAARAGDRRPNERYVPVPVLRLGPPGRAGSVPPLRCAVGPGRADPSDPCVGRAVDALRRPLL